MPPREGAEPDDAFAATIAPRSADPAYDATVAPPSDERTNPSRVAAAATPPAASDLPELPEVPTSHYKTDKEIARGGMGRILAAEDRRLGRPVAIKELIDPVADLGRFQREALITARLQHPGIVPVYEAGRWPSGEPFFAMKLVSGRPLDRVIADARSFEDRLRLLPRIAAATDAIAYAHSQRVIHRDLKPGNVLIGDFGETVVIDWGLAKDLDAGDSPESAIRTPAASSKTIKTSDVDSGSSTLTIAGAVMGTPAYMAPEQARGETVDQRADVFALGAMLYHLLAGTPPYNARTATDVIAAAALGKVVPIRERVRGAPGDLVAIVEQAMAPDVTDRYQNAGELADELRRFLTGQLVGAHEYSALERVIRFVKRHRAAVAIALVASIGFAVGGTIAINRIIRGEQAAKDAEQIAIARQQAAEGLVTYMQADVRDMLESVGRLDLLEKLGTSIHDYYDKLAKASGGMGSDDAERMATAIDVLGDAEMRSGKTDRAFETWSKARKQLVDVVGDDRTEATFTLRRLVARLDDQLGRVHQQRGRLDKALVQYTKARDGFETMREKHGTDRRLLLAAADANDHIGDVLRAQGKLDEAFEAYDAARHDRDKATQQGNSGKTTDELAALSTSHMKVGSVYQARGESDLALNEYRAALRQRETLSESEPDNVEFQLRLLEAQAARAEMERKVGNEKPAIETYRSALPTMDALYRRDPLNAVWKRQRGMMYADFGFMLFETGMFSEGNKQLAIALEIEQDLVDRDGTNSQYAVELSRTLTRAGDASIHLGDVDAGIARFEQALVIRERLAAKDPQSVPYRRMVAFSFHKLAGAYVHENGADLKKAYDLYEKALAIRDKLAGESAAAGDFKDELASTEVLLGRLLATRDPRRAAELIDSGLKRSKVLADTDPINNMYKETQTQGLLAKAALAKAQGQKQAQTAALEGARAMCESAMKRTENVRWTGYLAEVFGELGDWKLVRELLEPLAADGRLSWTRKALLERARASK